VISNDVVHLCLIYSSVVLKLRRSSVHQLRTTRLYKCTDE